MPPNPNKREGFREFEEPCGKYVVAAVKWKLFEYLVSLYAFVYKPMFIKTYTVHPTKFMTNVFNTLYI